MKTLAFSLMILSTHSYAETITPEDRFFDTKSEKYVRVCEQKDGKLVVKESCGKFWEELPDRKREDLKKEVKSLDGVDLHDTVLVNIKDKDGNMRTALTKVAFMYEDGQMTVSEYYTKRLGYTPGTTNWKIRMNNAVKLKKDHPLLQYKSLCAKDNTEFVYNWDGKRTFSLKKGEKVNLLGVFDNNTAMISLNQFGENFWGYGLNNQLPLSMDKLEVCEDEKELVNDSARVHSKETTTESHGAEDKQPEASSISK